MCKSLVLREMSSREKKMGYAGYFTVFIPFIHSLLGPWLVEL